jgi:hypothetical protein
MPTPTNIRFGSIVSGNGVVPGAKVSLNIGRMPFFQLVGTDFYLSFNSPTTTIPERASPDTLDLIRQAIDRNDLVLGDKPIQPEPTKGSFEKLYAEIDTAHNVEAVKDVLRKAIRRNGTINGVTRYEAVYKCIEHELTHQCRDGIIDFMVAVMGKIDGPTMVRETKEVVTLSKDAGYQSKIMPDPSIKLDI